MRFGTGAGPRPELEVLEGPGHATAELGYFERRSRTLVLGDAVTSFEWQAFQGHADPAAYRRTLTRLRAFVRERGVALALLAHHRPLAPDAFCRLLDVAQTQLDALDRLLEGATADQAHLQAAWDRVLGATGKAREFRSLAMVAAHIAQRRGGSPGE